MFDMNEENIVPEDVKKLVEENLKLTREIHAMTKKIKSYVTFQKILSVFYLLLFVIPLILTIVYIPIFLKNYLGSYQELLNDNQSAGNVNNARDILDQAQKMLNNK